MANAPEHAVRSARLSDHESKWNQHRGTVVQYAEATLGEQAFTSSRAHEASDRLDAGEGSVIQSVGRKTQSAL
jgi:hypothetical protein